MRFPTIWSLFCRAIALDSFLPGRRWTGAQMMADFQHDRTMDVEVLNGWYWVARREAIEQVGVLDERFFIYGEDIDWCRRFRDAGWRIVFYAGASAVHYGGASSAARPVRFYIEMQRANLQYWQKHHGHTSGFLYCGILLLHQALRAVAYTASYMAKADTRSMAAHNIRRSLATILWLIRPTGC
jgi:GT2 family glycosyltransferase